MNPNTTDHVCSRSVHVFHWRNVGTKRNQRRDSSCHSRWLHTAHARKVCRRFAEITTLTSSSDNLFPRVPRPHDAIFETDSFSQRYSRVSPLGRKREVAE